MKGPSMATQIVIINYDKLELIKQLKYGQPLDISVSKSIDCKPAGEISTPSIRVKAEENSLSIIKVGTGKSLFFNGESVSGATVRNGEKVTVDDCQIYAFIGKDTSLSTISEDNLRLLFHMTKSLSLSELDTLLPRLIDKLMEAFNSERGFILLRKKGSQQFEEAISRKIPKSEMGDAASRTIVREVIKQKKTIILGDGGQLYDGAKSIRADNIRSAIAAPLMSGNIVFGVVYLDSQVLRKIFTTDELTLMEAFTTHVSEAIKSALEKKELKQSLRFLRLLKETEDTAETGKYTIIGKSKVMSKVAVNITSVAQQNTTVLILGESGTGKELAARAIHKSSPRRNDPFVAVNCMALSRDITESELFGHEKGSFTGATEKREGRFELAEGGTIFLDEIGELSMDIQVKLLRVIEERQIERVGGNSPIAVDVRIIAATNKDLNDQVARGYFREDLYYRLNVFPILLPPLRERPEDIISITSHFINQCNKSMGRTISGTTEEAEEALLAYSWPGNIRELRNVIERSFILESGNIITTNSLPIDLMKTTTEKHLHAKALDPGIDSPRIGVSLAEARETFEIQLIQRTLNQNDGNVAKAAKELSVPRSTIYRKFAAAGIDLKKA
jgi:transcriptional regulator with GAF, ATPase, and Fis domain